MIDLRPEQELERQVMKRASVPMTIDLSAIGGKAETALRGNAIVAAAGWYPVAGGRGVAWAFFSMMRPREWVAVRQRLRATLDACPLRRIEATASAEFPEAILFLESLGFVREGLLKSYFDGVDCYMMARVAA